VGVELHARKRLQASPRVLDEYLVGLDRVVEVDGLCEDLERRRIEYVCARFLRLRRCKRGDRLRLRRYVDDVALRRSVPWLASHRQHRIVDPGIKLTPDSEGRPLNGP
jgi:hypothetical protein